MSEFKRQVLGRGLSALLDSTSSDEDRQDDIVPHSLPIDILIPGKINPAILFLRKTLSPFLFPFKKKEFCNRFWSEDF